MDTDTDKTLSYYDTNANSFIKGTVNADLSQTQNLFLSKLKKPAHILDFGCGSGRDTKYFLSQGCQVDAIDGSAVLCASASRYTGIQVKNILFQDLTAVDRYDGIWACSSILHLPPDELKVVMCKMITALKADGIIYASFKYGTFIGKRDGRFFIDMTEETFADFLRQVEGLDLEGQWVTADVRPGRGEERWLNLILRKRS